MQRFSSKEAAHAFLRQQPRERLIIDPSAVIYQQWVDVGKDVSVGPFSVVGKQGFGYEKISGRWERINHVGRVVLEDNVEIGALCTIDRAKLEKTIIRKGTKTDNLCHIAHNCDIGENCLLCAGVIIGGSCKIGNNTFIGLNATVKDHITIGDNCTIGCGANVVKDVPDGATAKGNPAK